MGHGESSDKMCSTGEGNGKALQYSCLENPKNSLKRQKDMTLKDELSSLVGIQYTTQYARKFGKLSSGHRVGKGQFSFQSQRKAMSKNVKTTTKLYSSHMLQSNAQNSPSEASTVCEL